MYPSESTENAPGLGVTSFKNPCGRKGCSHIFEYAGPNPLENISRLVNEHWLECPGRKTDATHVLDTRRGAWKRPQMRGEPSQSWGRGANYYRSISPDGRRWSSPPSPGGMDNTYAGPSGSGTTSTPSPSIRSTKSLPGSSAPAEKKTARSETERRVVLERDEWTASVTPHDVVCRGCRRTIKLDRRSRYYPGLWEKHRDRCEHVGRMRAERARAENTSATFPSTPSAGGGSYSPTLAPRKSFEPNQSHNYQYPHCDTFSFDLESRRPTDTPGLGVHPISPTFRREMDHGSQMGLPAAKSGPDPYARHTEFESQPGSRGLGPVHLIPILERGRRPPTWYWWHGSSTSLGNSEEESSSAVKVGNTEYTNRYALLRSLSCLLDGALFHLNRMVCIAGGPAVAPTTLAEWIDIDGFFGDTEERLVVHCCDDVHWVILTFDGVICPSATPAVGVKGRRGRILTFDDEPILLELAVASRDGMHGSSGDTGAQIAIYYCSMMVIVLKGKTAREPKINVMILEIVHDVNGWWIYQRQCLVCQSAKATPRDPGLWCRRLAIICDATQEVPTSAQSLPAPTILWSRLVCTLVVAAPVRQLSATPAVGRCIEPPRRDEIFLWLTGSGYLSQRPEIGNISLTFWSPCSSIFTSMRASSSVGLSSQNTPFRRWRSGRAQPDEVHILRMDGQQQSTEDSVEVKSLITARDEDRTEAWATFYYLEFADLQSTWNSILLAKM
ncbi:hypothetical protein C8R44DRAFT_741001 [Mycena epipterygia]|nr:hypothetical protein C8R44DRAFT_741001 [Mycena epipterygia]